jgi:CRISPR-associated protein Cas5d
VRSDYDDYGEMAFGLMFHGFDYPDELGKDGLYARFWRPKMINGKIDFIRPEACDIRKLVRTMKANPPRSVGLDDGGLLEDCEEWGALK